MRQERTLAWLQVPDVPELAKGLTDLRDRFSRLPSARCRRVPAGGSSARSRSRPRPGNGSLRPPRASRRPVRREDRLHRRNEEAAGRPARWHARADARARWEAGSDLGQHGAAAAASAGSPKADRGLTIGLVPPRPKGSNELKGLADFKVNPVVTCSPRRYSGRRGDA